jgi:hypothetical protein
MLLPSTYVLYVTFNSPVGGQTPAERALRLYSLWAEVDTVIRALNNSADVSSVRVFIESGRVARPLTRADMGYDVEEMSKVE